jgi:hypothetical protein
MDSNFCHFSVIVSPGCSESIRKLRKRGIAQSKFITVGVDHVRKGPRVTSLMRGYDTPSGIAPQAFGAPLATGIPVQKPRAREAALDRNPRRVAALAGLAEAAHRTGNTAAAAKALQEIDQIRGAEAGLYRAWKELPFGGNSK